MATPRLIGRPPPSAPELESARTIARDLPDDLLREASRRLGIVSLVVAALWLIAVLLDHVTVWALSEGTHQFRFDEDDAFGAGTVAVSLAMFVYSRRANGNPRYVLDLGLVYMVAMAIPIALLMHWWVVIGRPTPRIMPMISWNGVLVLIFAAIVPATPKKAFVAAFLAASMAPAVLLIAVAAGRPLGPLSNVLIVHYPDLILAGVAVVISHVVTRLGQQIVRARDLGSYRLGELIGEGGMGKVYRATHRMLARPAAIKLIRREGFGAKTEEAAQLAVRRFRREAETAARLQSPHTVGLYDFGVTEDGTFYLVMELLEGSNLESLVRQKGPLPAARVIHILRQVCESLEEAHAAGLIHRDIKPANIHLGRMGLRHDFVKVLDFGLVKSVAEGLTEDSLATAEGLTPGTPAYMPPEIARGEAVDGRTDLYALGCVAYFLLTGQLVFEASSALQMVTKHLQDPPVAPSQRAELPVPPELDRLILSCLAKKPSERPASARALEQSLAAIGVEPWTEEQAAQWWQMNRPDAPAA